MNDNRAANVQRLAAIVSEREQALPAASIQTTIVRLYKTIKVSSFLLLFSSCFLKEEKSKDYFEIKSLFLNVLFFLFICDVKRKKSTKRKRKHATASYALTSVEQNGCSG